MKSFKEFQIEHVSKPKQQQEQDNKTWQDFAETVINDIDYLNTQYKALQKEFSIFQDELIAIKHQL